MKRFFAILAILAIASVALALYGTGWGKTVEASTTTTHVDGFTANTVSVINQGTNDVFCLVNTTTNAFNTRLAAGTTIKVPGTTTYEFDANQQTSIDNLYYATTNLVSDVVIGAY